MDKYITLLYKEYLELIEYKEAIEELNKELRRAEKFHGEERTELKVYDTPKIFGLLEYEFKIENNQWLTIHRNKLIERSDK